MRLSLSITDPIVNNNDKVIAVILNERIHRVNTVPYTEGKTFIALCFSNILASYRSYLTINAPKNVTVRLFKRHSAVFHANFLAFL